MTPTAEAPVAAQVTAASADAARSGRPAQNSDSGETAPELAARCRPAAANLQSAGSAYSAGRMSATEISGIVSALTLGSGTVGPVMAAVGERALQASDGAAVSKCPLEPASAPDCPGLQK